MEGRSGGCAGLTLARLMGHPRHAQVLQSVECALGGAPALGAPVNKRNLSTGETRDSAPKIPAPALNLGVECARP